MRWPLFALFVGVGWVAIAQHTDTAWQHKAKSSAKQLTIAMLLYATDSDDVLPYAQNDETWLRVLYPYVKNRDVLVTSNPQKSKWNFNVNLGGVNITTLKSPVTTPVLRDGKLWPSGERVTGFIDGHVEALAPAKQKASDKAWATSYKREAKKPLPADHFKKEAGF